MSIIGPVSKILIYTICLLTLRVYSKTLPSNAYVECNNYCAFSDKRDNCNGVYFREDKKDQFSDYLSSHYSKLYKSCVYSRGLRFKRVRLKRIKNFCRCSTQLNKRPKRKHKKMSLETKEKLLKLKESIKEWVQCAPNPLEITAPRNLLRPFGASDIISCNKKDMKPYPILGGCLEGVGQLHFNPCKYYGNTMNFAGPLCFSGNKLMCDAIKSAQDPNSGAWYRNAYQRRFPLSERGQPLFSRDELQGVLFYIAATKDKARAFKWLMFLRDNPKKGLSFISKKIKVYNICPPHVSEKPNDITEEEWEKMLPDDRCEMRTGWAEIYSVLKYIGVKDEEIKSISKGFLRKMKLTSKIDKVVSNVSTRTVPRFTYQMTLQAKSALLQLLINNNTFLNKNTLKVANRRAEYDNPLFHFAAMKGNPTEYGASLILKYCPSKMPNYISSIDGLPGRAHASFMGVFARYNMGIMDGREIVMPTGHECIGWINFYTQKFDSYVKKVIRF